MALAKGMALGSLKLLAKYEEGKHRDIQYIEFTVDNLQAEIVSFFGRYQGRDFHRNSPTGCSLTPPWSTHIERIGDYATNLAELAMQKHKRRIGFTRMGNEELTGIERLIGENHATA